MGGLSLICDEICHLGPSHSVYLDQYNMANENGLDNRDPVVA
jgi:hypothetical protein